MTHNLNLKFYLHKSSLLHFLSSNEVWKISIFTASKDNIKLLKSKQLYHKKFSREKKSNIKYGYQGIPSKRDRTTFSLLFIPGYKIFFLSIYRL